MVEQLQSSSKFFFKKLFVNRIFEAGYGWKGVICTEVLGLEYSEVIFTRTIKSASCKSYFILILQVLYY